MGTLYSTATSVAILGVEQSHAGVASATVNAVQQVGGSIGTALLNTIATAATAAYLSAHLAGAGEEATSTAVVHGYTIAYWVGTGIFTAGALITALVLRSGVPEQLRHHGSSAESQPAVA
jgi:hypothetical protein